MLVLSGLANDIGRTNLDIIFYIQSITSDDL